MEADERSIMNDGDDGDNTGGDGGCEEEYNDDFYSRCLHRSKKILRHTRLQILPGLPSSSLA